MAESAADMVDLVKRASSEPKPKFGFLPPGSPIRHLQKDYKHSPGRKSSSITKEDMAEMLGNLREEKGLEKGA